MDRIYSDLLTILDFTAAKLNDGEHLEGVSANNIQYIQSVVKGALNRANTEATAR